MHLGHQCPQGETLAACTSLLLSIESATAMPGRVQEEVKDEVEIKLLLVTGRTMRRIGPPVMSPRLVVQNPGFNDTWKSFTAETKRNGLEMLQ